MMDLEKVIWRKLRQEGLGRSLNKKTEWVASRKGRAVSAQPAAQPLARQGLTRNPETQGMTEVMPRYKAASALLKRTNSRNLFRNENRTSRIRSREYSLHTA